MGTQIILGNTYHLNIRPASTSSALAAACISSLIGLVQFLR